MGKIRFVLSNILFWPIIAISAILINSFSVYEVSSENFGFTNYAFYLIAGAGLVLSILFWILEHKNNRVIAHPLYFPIIFGIAILSIVTIWLQKDRVFTNPNTDFSITANIGVDLKIKLSVALLLFYNAIYTLIFVVSRRTFRLKQTFWFIRLFVLFVIVSIVYSIIKDFDSIKAVFENKEIHNYTIKSFFYNENFFASLIFIAMIGVMILNYYKVRVYNYILIFGLYVYMILTTCTSTFIIGSLALILYIVLDLATLFKKHWIVATIVTSVVILLAAGLFVACILMIENEVGWISSFVKFVQTKILNKDFSTFTGRTDIWKIIWEDLNSGDKVNLLIGRGFGISSIYIRSLFLSLHMGSPINAMSSTHNGIMEILYSSGFIGVGFYALLVVSVLVAFILLCIKKKFRFAFLYLLSFVSVISYSMFESTTYFGKTMFDLVITVITLIPMFNAVRVLYKPRIAKPLKEGNYCYTKMNYLRLKSFVTIILLSAVSILLMFFVYTLIFKAPSFIDLPIALAISGILIIFAPQIVSLFYKDATRRRFIFRMIFYTALLISANIAIPFIFKAINDVHALPLGFNKFTWLMELAFTFIYLLILFIVFTLMKKESLKSYFKFTYLEPILSVKFALPISFVLGLVSLIFFNLFRVSSGLTQFATYTISFITYYLLFALLPSIRNYYYVHFINERMLFNLKKVTNKYEI